MKPTFSFGLAPFVRLCIVSRSRSTSWSACRHEVGGGVVGEGVAVAGGDSGLPVAASRRCFTCKNTVRATPVCTPNLTTA